MIWFRRILTVPLIFAFVVLFIVVLLVTQVNGTVGSPGFYTSQLRQADMYNFLYDEVVPAALDEIEEDESSDHHIDIPAIKDEAVSTARQILPPEWLQEQVESAINSMLPYFTGDTDEFTYTLTFRDRVETAAEVLKRDTLDSEAFTSLYDDTMAYAAEQLVENLDQAPYPLSLTEEDVADSLKDVAPEDWVASQIEAAIDSVTPYWTGDSDHFTVTIMLYDRIDDVARAFLDLISRQETYDYLLDEMIAPTIASSLGVIVNLPFEVSLTQEEIASVIKDVLPQSWVRARLQEVVDGIAAYVKGEADSIEVIVSLADRKEDALQALATLADQELSEYFYSLPTCTMAEFVLAVRRLQQGSLPDCRPLGMSYEQFKNELGIDIADSIDQMIGDQIPDQWEYTDADLRQSFGEGNEQFLDDIRDHVTGGWKYTDADLLDDLDPDQEETLNDVRDWIENGYTWTDEDLRDEMVDADMDTEILDEVRHWTGVARTWLWTLWIIPVLLLLFIGLLGGRNWRSRLSWALVVLFVTSLAVFIAVNVTYSNVGEPRLEEALFEPSEYEGLEATMAEKGNEVIQNVVDAFRFGIQSKTIYFMIGSGVVLLGIVAWTVVRRSREPETDSAVG